MRTLLTLGDRIAAFLTAIGKAAGWLAVVLMVVIVFDVVGRRFFDTGSSMLQELEWHLHGALFLLAFGFAYLRDAHVRIELLRERWRPRRRAWVEAAGIVFFLLPYCALVIWFGYDFAERAFLRGEGSVGGMGLPHRWVIKSVLPIGFAVLALAGLSVLIRLIAVLMDRDADGKGHAFLGHQPGARRDETTT